MTINEQEMEFNNFPMVALARERGGTN